MCDVPDGEDTWREPACTKACCADCGWTAREGRVKCPLEDAAITSGEKEHIWYRFENVTVMEEDPNMAGGERPTIAGVCSNPNCVLCENKERCPDGKVKKRQDLVHSPVSFSTIRAATESMFSDWILHRFVADFNDYQIQQIKEWLPFGAICCMSDWSMNPAARPYWATQNMNWKTIGAVLQTVPVFYHSAESTPENPKVVYDLFSFWSDNMDRDPEAYIYALGRIHAHLRGIQVEIDTVFNATDGCSSQYKGGRCQYAMGAFAFEYKLHVHAIFYATGHGLD
jgi:hypothetical protein